MISARISRWLLNSNAKVVLALALACMVSSCIALAIIPWDQQISEAARAIKVPGDIRKTIELSEAFAHGSGCTVILMAVFLTLADRRRAVLLAILMTITSGVMANGLKAAFVRLRPYALATPVSDLLIESGSQTPALLSGDAGDPGIRGNASSGIDFLGSGSFWDASQRSFPSGHSATAWGLAIGLSLLFPRSTVLMVGLATLASFQRLYSGAHFPSDIFAGAAIAFFCCATIIAWPGARRIFESNGA